jgi:hypothetical protein
LKHEKTEWIAWAKDKADWYDPTINKNDSILGMRNHNSDFIPVKKDIPYR